MDRHRLSTDQQIAGHGAGNTFCAKRLRQTRDPIIYTL